METALPNLHPAILHLPLVLLPLAVLVDVASFWRRKDNSLNVVATVLWLMGTLSTVATYYAGRWAADGLVDVPAEAWLAVSTHSDRAWWVVALAVAAAVARCISWMKRLNVPARGVTLVFGIALGPLLAMTADAGGALVYRHALGVTLLEPAPCPACDDAVSATASLVRDGSRTTWTPASLETSFTGFDSITGGARVDVVTERTLQFPGEWGDVQLNVWFDASEFDGAIELMHHIIGDTSGRLVVTEASVSLLGRTGEVLDQGDEGVTGAAAVAVNIAGTHLKGLINGRIVAHGHSEVDPPGAVGIRFVGSGTVLLTRVEATELEPH